MIRLLRLIAVCTIGVAFATVPIASVAQSVIGFDAPGAGTGSGQGTVAYANNAAGAVTGYYIDSNGAFHGFLRATNGVFTTIDVSGAGTGSGQGTVAYSISRTGEIAGYYLDASGVSHGFLRFPDGAMTTLDVPAAGTGSGQGTAAFAISQGIIQTVTGGYTDASGVNHCFLQTAEGAMSTFDAPDAGTGSGQGTEPAGIDGMNAAGAITGNYNDASGVYHGFLRVADGAITTFDAPGAGTVSGQGTYASGINSSGAILGEYLDANTVWHSFLRTADGTISTFDVTSAGTSAGQGTVGESINPAGAIPGYYVDASNAFHGFLRAPNGVITTFDAPGAGAGVGQGTIPFTNNPAGAVTGYYIDSNGAYHGFIAQQFESGPGPTQLSPVNLNFGPQPINSASLPKTISLTNKGSVAVRSIGISITGSGFADFSQTNTCGTSLAAGATCQIKVTFTPSSIGAWTANLSVSDSRNPRQSVSLAGSGT